MRGHASITGADDKACAVTRATGHDGEDLCRDQ